MSNLVRHCSHCNNISPYVIVYRTNAERLWEDGPVWTKFGDEPWVKGDWLTHYESYLYCVVKCATCGHLSLLGEFDPTGKTELHELSQLYPMPPELSLYVPEAIRNTYLEAATIRVRAPHAYVGQIRKALELICVNKGVTGRNLLQKLEALVRQGILPSTIGEMTDLIRQIGNVGVHSEGQRISILDTDLVDEFFRTVVEYVYVVPAKIAELKRRIAHDKEPPDDVDIPF